MALLDWLHWGGQLIISGPETLDTLGTSFLAEYLPAASGGNRDLAEPDLAEINRHWTLPFRGREGRRLAPTTTWSAVRLKLHPEGEYVATTGGLLAERTIGRGRIVLSAFKLSSRELVAWPGFDGFFNGCLLRRPARRFGGAPEEFFVHWADARAATPGGSTPGQFDTERLCGLRDSARRGPPGRRLRRAGSDGRRAPGRSGSDAGGRGGAGCGIRRVVRTGPHLGEKPRGME